MPQGALSPAEASELTLPGMEFAAERQNRNGGEGAIMPLVRFFVCLSGY